MGCTWSTHTKPQHVPEQPALLRATATANTASTNGSDGQAGNIGMCPAVAEISAPYSLYICQNHCFSSFSERFVL